jgi:outer membrane receptor protein involved in Fe transport
MKACLFLIFLSPLFVFSQINLSVNNAETREPLQGVKVIASDGEKLITNSAGKATLNPTIYPISIIVSFTTFDTDTLFFASKGDRTILLKPSTKELSTVVIAVGRRRQKAEEVSVSMEVLKPTLIDNKGITDLEQAVDQTPGVYAMDGQVSIRGGSGFSYGVGSRVMLLWNGVPMLAGDAGDSKWNAIPMEQASQVEVIKGASSVLYGSGALNGIISLTEREPTAAGETRVKIMTGMYGNPKRETLKWWNHNPFFEQVEAFHGKMNKQMGYTISTTVFNNKGYRQGETESRARISGTIFYKPSNTKNLKVGMGYNFQTQKTGNFFIWQSDTFAYTPSGGADTSLASSTLTYNIGTRVNIDPYLKFSDSYNNQHSLKTRLYYSNNNNITNPSQSSEAIVSYSDYQFQRLGNNKKVFTSGMTMIYNDVHSILYGNHFSTNAALYSQYEQRIGKLDITGGFRFEYFEQDNTKEDSEFKWGKKEKATPVYPIFRAGLHYQLHKATHLRASFGQGVRYPSVAERFVTTNVGALNVFPNNRLKRELGWAAELGIKQGVKIGEWKGMLDLAGFINEYANMMEFTFGVFNPTNGNPIDLNTPTGQQELKDLQKLGYTLNNFFGFQSQNAEKARISGIEFSFTSQGKIKQVELVSLIGYTYMNPVSLNKDPYYVSNFSDSGSTLLKYRFKHLARADVEATWKKHSIGCSMRYNSFMANIDRTFEDGILGNQILPGLKTYRAQNKKGSLVFDLRYGYNFTPAYRIGIMINNLLNAEYSTRPGDVQPPRTFLIQLQMKF